MHHVVIERWSRHKSALHRRDARAKLGALLAFLVAVSTTDAKSQFAFCAYAALLAGAIVAARLPFTALLRRALLALPFAATFALITWWSGDTMRALALAEKSYLSGLAALLLVATTPIPDLLRGLELLRAPRLLTLVIHFLYRYLFVISEQAQHMRLAAESRRGLRFRSAAGALAVLFARSWERADGVYRAMLARGFSGRFPTVSQPHWHAGDAVFFVAAVCASLTIRVAL